jgi:orotate phosphoribosyltransferase
MITQPFYSKPISQASGLIQTALNIGAIELLPEGRKLKSGRISPYFFNSGLFTDGNSLNTITRALAHVVRNLEFEVIFVPPYKGIPLCTDLCQHLGSPYEWGSYRKEEKTHGDGGLLMGASLEGKKVLIVDDVITTGESKIEAIEIIRQAGGTPVGCAILFDRQEKGYDFVNEVDLQKSAKQDFEEMFDIPLLSASNLDDLLSFLSSFKYRTDIKDIYGEILAYKELYGV